MNLFICACGVSVLAIIFAIVNMVVKCYAVSLMDLATAFVFGCLALSLKGALPIEIPHFDIWLVAATVVTLLITLAQLVKSHDRMRENQLLPMYNVPRFVYSAAAVVTTVWYFLV